MWYAGRNPFSDSREPIISGLLFMFITQTVPSPGRPSRLGATSIRMANHFRLAGWRKTAVSGLSAHKYSGPVP